MRSCIHGSQHPEAEKHWCTVARLRVHVEVKGAPPWESILPFHSVYLELEPGFPGLAAGASTC